MRKTLMASMAASIVASGAAAYAYANPFERFERMRREQPAPPPARQRPATVPGAAAGGASAAGGAMVADQGVHNAVHAAHQGRIVFTRSDLGIDAITEGDIATEFTLGQPMFFRVFTERSAVNAIAMANGIPAREVYPDGVHYTARFTIDGQVFDTSILPWGGRRDHETWTTWRGQFVNPGTAQRTPGTDAFLEMLSRATSAGLLKPGRNGIAMEVIPQTNTERRGPIKAGVVATGRFDLIVPAGAFRAGNAAVCGPGRGGGGTAATEARALAHARQFWDWPDLTLVKAIATGRELTIERNKLTGIPIERYTDVAILARGPKYCTSHTHKFTEQYAGAGTYAPGGISVNFTPGFVPCACLG